MTALGKILVFVILVLSLVWNFLVVNGYATRTNWKVTADKWQQEAKKAAESAGEAKKLLDEERAAAGDATRVLREERDRLYSQLAAVSGERDTLFKQYNDAIAAAQKQGQEVTQLLANVERLTKQVDAQDAQLKATAKTLDELTLAANADRVRANNAELVATAQRERAERLADRVRELGEELEGARRAGIAGRAGGSKPAAPAPTGFKGTVRSIQVDGGQLLVALTPGSDAGLQRGAELTVRRLAPEARFVGTIRIVAANPKDAVGVFVPPAGRRLDPNNPNDFPKAGDELVP
jgi:hypothetical protein